MTRAPAITWQFSKWTKIVVDIHFDELRRLLGLVHARPLLLRSCCVHKNRLSLSLPSLIFAYPKTRLTSCVLGREIMEATAAAAAATSNKKTSRNKKDDLFHVIHKVPSGDGPYVRAKHAQLVEKDPEAAIVLFWKAINAGDRVDSALKDMAVVMKQLDRAEEAIEAVKSFRGRCSKQAQESLDNVLIDLYKKCGKVDEQIELLKRKLRLIYQGEAFNGKPTKTARSHGKKFQVSVKQETSRLLGNLGWAYMQKSNFMAAEVVYKKAQMVDADANKACNLGLCLIKQARYSEARSVVEDVLQGRLPGSEDCKSRKRAEELLVEVESRQAPAELSDLLDLNLDSAFVKELEQLMSEWAPSRSKRLPIFEEISSFRDQLAC